MVEGRHRNASRPLSDPIAWIEDELAVRPFTAIRVISVYSKIVLVTLDHVHFVDREKLGNCCIIVISSAQQTEIYIGYHKRSLRISLE